MHLALGLFAEFISHSVICVARHVAHTVSASGEHKIVGPGKELPEAGLDGRSRFRG